MDTEPSLSPLPPCQSNTLSPSLGHQKRSISEVESPAMPPQSPKRGLTETPGENQENQDPSIDTTEKDRQSPQAKEKVSVEIPFNVYTQNTMSDHVQSSVLQMSSVSSPPRPASVGSTVNHDGSVAPAAKKRKLSPASQQVKQQEKEAKERLKNEEKQRKEEEKRNREEEKRLKEEEKRKREAEREEERKHREEKKKAKEEEKAAKEAAKEEEKKRKEEEKVKKERAQPKLNSFFAKPKLPSPTISVESSSSPSKPAAVNDTPTESPTPHQSEYHKAFPEFFLQSHTTIAPPHRFQRHSEALQHVRQTIDQSLNPTSDLTLDHLPFRPSEIFHLIPFSRRQGQHPQSVKEILRRIQTVADPTQPGTTVESGSVNDPHQLLRKITMKSIKFGEDVRPPYQGTFTREVPAPSAKKLCRNPYYRGLPDVNYDYDSEAEWEEPEEGEELDSEEEEESDEGEDDMDGFLDDEDDALAGGKRRLIVGDLEPVCSGIRWASDGGMDVEFKGYQIQTISDAVRFPIDPFSTSYWQKPRAEPASAKGSAPIFKNLTRDLFRANPCSQTLPPVTTKASKAKRPFPAELLPEFKQAVEGSDLSKLGLVETLKKKFPKVPKDTLKSTLDEVAVRVGGKQVDKKWVCR